jgi:hypothetical protein
MCWNQYVSINSFIFSAVMLGLMVYNNKYSPYKRFGSEVVNYIFLASFISMQLVEFFLWRNLGNPFKNKVWSFVGQSLLGLQPAASLFLVKNNTVRNGMLTLYSAFVVYLCTKYDVTQIETKKAPNGHLHWKWVPVSWPERLLWLFFLLFSFVYNRDYLTAFVAITLFAVTYYSFSKHRTAGSLWCWMINLTMLAYAVYLLVIAPFSEHGLATC